MTSYINRKIRVMHPFLTNNDLKPAIDLLRKKWLTNAINVRLFEKEMANYLGKKYGIGVNSGSSANLLMIETLKYLKRLERKIIMPALNWGTTVSPIIQCGFIPIFVDITFNNDGFLTLDKEQVLQMVEKYKNVSIFPIYTLGFEPDEEIFNLPYTIFADCCDSLNKLDERVIMASLSFFMAHHIVAGEGGMIITDNLEINRIARAIHDSGRKCYLDCPFWKESNICRQIANPEFICPHSDWRMTFKLLGYNLKMLEICAAIGREQLKKADRMLVLRKRNAKLLSTGLSKLKEYLIIPKFSSSPSWFSFPIICKNGINKENLVRYLNRNQIETRPILSGNIIRQELLIGQNYISSFPLIKTDIVHNKGFMIGCHPNLTRKDIKYIIERVKIYFENNKI